VILSMAGEFRWHLWKDTHRRRIDRLKLKLGGKCPSCGEDCLDELQFHHPEGKQWRSNQVGPSERIRRYEAEAAAGLVELLCGDCHKRPNEHLDTCFCPVCRGDF
jgi:hypothetical protein